MLPSSERGTPSHSPIEPGAFAPGMLLERALALLEQLPEAFTGEAFLEIGRRMNLPPTEALRYLGVLVLAGAVLGEGNRLIKARADRGA